MNTMNELYYKDAYLKSFDAKVIDCIEDKKGWAIVLDDTAFYPEGGGQLSDKGHLNDIEVFDVKKKNDVIYHYTKTPLEPNTIVHGVIDWNVRFDHMQQHSGEHIFSGLVHKYYGYDNIGFHMGEDVLTLDFSGPLTYEQCLELESKANDYIALNNTTVITFPDEKTRETLDYRAKIELTGTVRIVEFVDADVCACCGTHVAKASEVQMIKVLSCINKKGGTRVEVICGKRALTYLGKMYEQTRNLSHMFSAKPLEIEVAVNHLQDENAKLKTQVIKYLNEYLENKLNTYPESDKCLILFENDLAVNNARKFASDLVNNHKCSTCALFIENATNTNYILVSNKINLRDISKTLNTTLNGKGGGSPEMLQGTLNASKDDIINVIKDLLGD